MNDTLDLNNNFCLADGYSNSQIVSICPPLSEVYHFGQTNWRNFLMMTNIICIFLPTYVSSLISSILTSQIFRKQFWGALSELYHTTLWEMLYLKMSRFVSLLYKQEFFYYFMWMSPWRSGSMQVSHAEGPWFQSRSSSFFKFFFLQKYLFFNFSYQNFSTERFLHEFERENKRFV